RRPFSSEHWARSNHGAYTRIERANEGGPCANAEYSALYTARREPGGWNGLLRCKGNEVPASGEAASRSKHRRFNYSLSLVVCAPGVQRRQYFAGGRHGAWCTPATWMTRITRLTETRLQNCGKRVDKFGRSLSVQQRGTYRVISYQPDERADGNQIITHQAFW